MATLRSLCSQYMLQLTTSCNLKCGFCPLWQVQPKRSANVLPLIKAGTFFDLFPRKQLYNVLGGEPLLKGELGVVLAYLKSEGIRTRLWTNAQLPLDVLATCFGSVDEFMLYFPSPDPDDYQLLTGMGEWTQFESNLDYLLAEGQSVVLQFPILPDTVDRLAEAYELAYYRGLGFLAHYCVTDPFSKETRRYIERFRRVKGVWLYPLKYRNEGACPAVPTQALRRPWPQLSNHLDELMNGLPFRFRV